MSTFTYIIVEHDGGWAYKLDSFSETYQSHDDALAAAQIAAAVQRTAGKTTPISWEDDQGSGTTRLPRAMIDQIPKYKTESTKKGGNKHICRPHFGARGIALSSAGHHPIERMSVVGCYCVGSLKS